MLLQSVAWAQTLGLPSQAVVPRTPSQARCRPLHAATAAPGRWGSPWAPDWGSGGTPSPAALAQRGTYPAAESGSMR